MPLAISLTIGFKLYTLKNTFLFDTGESMKKYLLLVIAIILGTCAQGICADTEFFGAIDTYYTSNDNLTDAQSDKNDSMEYMATKLTLGVENRIGANLRGVAAFEVGDIVWGIDGKDYPQGRNSGGGASGDGVNVETKNIYLDFNLLDKPLNIRCGLMPFDIADGIIAGDDAFGAAFTLSNDMNATINIIKVYQDSLGNGYYNKDDSDRNENYYDIEMSQDITESLNMNLFVGALIDRYNGPESAELDRDIFYIGIGSKIKHSNLLGSIDFIGNAGTIKSSDVEGNPPEGETPVKQDASGYLVKMAGTGEYGRTGLGLEFIYASGDDPKTADKEEGFIVPETSYKTDIAEILTRGDLSNELSDDEGDNRYAAHKYTTTFSNVYFIKLSANFQHTKKSNYSAALIYAALPREMTIADNIKAHKIGTEIDLRFDHSIYISDDQSEGLTVSLIGAILLSGDVFDEYSTADDGSTYNVKKSNNIVELGARLSYEF